MLGKRSDGDVARPRSTTLRSHTGTAVVVGTRTTSSAPGSNGRAPKSASNNATQKLN
jgi:hypothetical protein